MKNNLVLVLLVSLLFGFYSMAYAQTNHIFQGSFEACKQQAAQENKIILVDLYFEGCMPCKEMDDKVFPDPAVVKVLGPDFILYKTDVFKEEDGMKLARKYGVSGFPTYVAVDASGKTLLIDFGFFSVNRFVPLLEKAKSLRAANQFLAFDTDLNKSYPNFYNYRYMRKGEKGEATDLHNFLKGKDLFEEVPFVISTMVSTPELDSWVYKNLAQLIDMYSPSLLLNKLIKIGEKKIQGQGEAQDLNGLKETLAYIRPVFNDRLWKAFVPSFVHAYYQGSKNGEAYMALADTYAIFPTWAHRSNALGGVIIDQKSNKAFLEKVKQDYLAQQSKAKLSDSDQYKLSLIYAYLGDFATANTVLQALLDIDLLSPMNVLKKEDVVSLHAAIAKKDLVGFQPKDAKVGLPMSMD